MASGQTKTQFGLPEPLPEWHRAAQITCPPPPQLLEQPLRPPTPPRRPSAFAAAGRPAARRSPGILRISPRGGCRRPRSSGDRADVNRIQNGYKTDLIRKKCDLDPFLIRKKCDRPRPKTRRSEKMRSHIRTPQLPSPAAPLPR